MPFFAPSSGGSFASRPSREVPQARRSRSFRLSRLAVLPLLAAVAACNSASTVTPAPTPPVTGDELPVDEPGATTGDPDAGKATADGGSTEPVSCPAPSKIAPAKFDGYLAAAVVTFHRGVDGDTAHFDFPSEPDQVVRFQFINAEETSGDNKTDYGLETSAIVTDILRDATSIAIALQETAPGSGLPNHDDFGRLLGLVFVDGDLLQTKIVRDGRSPYFARYGCAPGAVHDAILFAEAEAFLAQRGIWAPDHPTKYQSFQSYWVGPTGCRPNPYKTPYCK